MKDAEIRKALRHDPANGRKVVVTGGKEPEVQVYVKADATTPDRPKWRLVRREPRWRVEWAMGMN